MYLDSDHFAGTAATLASLTATCELLGFNPWTCLRDILTHLPVSPISQLDKLLPKPAG